MRKEGAVRLHAMDAWPEVFSGENILRMQNGDEFIPGKPSLGFLNLYDNVLVVILLCGVVVHQLDPWYSAQVLTIDGVVSPVRCNQVVNSFHACDAHRGADFGHLPVGPDVDHIVEAGKAEIRHEPDPPGQGVIIGADGSSFKRVQELRRVEAEDLSQSKSADHAAVVGAAKGVSRIKHQTEIAPLGDLLEGGDITRPAPHVRCKNRSGAWSDVPLDPGWVDVVGAGIHVGENGSDFLPLEGMCGRHKGVGRDDHLTAQFGGTGHDFQAYRRVADTDDVLDPHEVCDAALKLLYKWAVVGEPAAVQHVIDPGKESLPVPDVGPADMYQGWEGW